MKQPISVTIPQKTQMDTQPIEQVLGDSTPAITPDALGRYRLQNALRNKFGSNYRANPQASTAMNHFEKEHDFFQKLRQIQYKQKG